MLASVTETIATTTRANKKIRRDSNDDDYGGDDASSIFIDENFDNKHDNENDNDNDNDNDKDQLPTTTTSSHPLCNRWWFTRHSSPVVSFSRPSNTVTNNSNKRGSMTSSPHQSSSSIVPIPPAATAAAASTTKYSCPSSLSSSGIVLSENLATTSDVVESLTHDVSNWSLSRIHVSAIIENNSSSSSKTGTERRISVLQSNDDTKISSINNNTIKNESTIQLKRRCRDAFRQVRRAQRQFVEEHHQLSFS